MISFAGKFSYYFEKLYMHRIHHLVTKYHYKTSKKVVTISNTLYDCAKYLHSEKHILPLNQHECDNSFFIFNQLFFAVILIADINMH